MHALVDDRLVKYTHVAIKVSKLRAFLVAFIRLIVSNHQQIMDAPTVPI